MSGCGINDHMGNWHDVYERQRIDGERERREENRLRFSEPSDEAVRERNRLHKEERNEQDR